MLADAFALKKCIYILTVGIRVAADQKLLHPAVIHLSPKWFQMCSGPISFGQNEPVDFVVPPYIGTGAGIDLDQQQFVIDAMAAQNTSLKDHYDVDRIMSFLEHMESLALFQRLTFKETIENLKNRPPNLLVYSQMCGDGLNFDSVVDVNDEKWFLASLTMFNLLELKDWEFYFQKTGLQ